MPVGVSAYVPLATKTLTVAATAVSFSSITNSYRDLIVVASNLNLASSQQLYLQFNLDASAIYNRVFMVGTTITASAADSNTTQIVLTNGAFTTNGQLLINILDYSATDKHKSVLSRYNNAGLEVVAVAGRYATNTAINRVEVGVFGVNFAIGSTFTLYGIAA